MKKIFLVLLLATVSSLFSQQNNSLLWQISGKGLKAPSYLFGSIHITDKRVFDFPDSVLAKLKECEVTAFELNFDSLSDRIVQEILKRSRHKSMKELFSETEIAQYREALKKKNISADRLESETPMEIYRRYEHSLLKNDMRTFLDAYLFGIAKQYGKPILGIEKFEEQIGIYEDMQEKDQKEILRFLTDSSSGGNSYMDSMITIYVSQDIDKVYRFVHKETSTSFKDKLLIKRNHTMDHRIDSLIQLRSAFICVGTAHLPGQEGLIELLRNRGYSVTPVFSPRTGYYKKFLPKSATYNWKTIKDDNGGYFVKMPGEPSNFNIMGLEMKGYMDFGSGYFFFSTAVPTMTHDKKASEKVTQSMVDRITAKGGKPVKKSISYNGMKGYEVEMTLEESLSYQLRVLGDTGRTYILMVGYQNTSERPDKEVSKIFFNSLQPTAPVVTEDIYYRDDTVGFKILAPKSFKPTREENEGETKYRVYSCVDYSIQGLISMNYVDYAKGMYIPDAYNLYTLSYEPVQKATQVEPAEVKDFSLQGFPARDYKILTSDGSLTYLRYVLRGNRLFIVGITSKDATLEKDVFKILTSFTLLPTLKAQNQVYTSPEKDFKVTMPGEVMFTIDSTSKNLTYEYGAADKFTNNWFNIYRHSFDKYDHFKDDSTLFKLFEKQFVGENDSLEVSSMSLKNNMHYYDFRISPLRNTGIIKFMRVIVNGQKYYTLSRVDNPAPGADSVNSFYFNSFEPVANKNFDVFAPKTELIFTNMMSKDSATHLDALQALQSYDFTKKDIPALEKLLTQKFPDDTAASDNTRELIYTQIFSATDSIDKIALIERLYPSMPDSGGVRCNALQQLADLGSKEALASWKKLVLTYPLKPVYEYDMLRAAGQMRYDAVKEIPSLYPDLFRLQEQPRAKYLFYRISANAVKQNLLKSSFFVPHKAEMLKECNSEYSRMATGSERYSLSFDDALYILNLLPATDDVTALNQKVVSDTVIYSKLDSYMYLVRNNVPLNKKLFTKYLVSPYERLEMYDTLKAMNRLDIFPAELKKQKSLAEADLSARFMDEFEEEPQSLQLLEERKMLYNGTTQRFFLYKIHHGESTYFGLAGPFPLSDKELVARGLMTGFDSMPFEDRTINEHIQALLGE